MHCHLTTSRLRLQFWWAGIKHFELTLMRLTFEQLCPRHSCFSQVEQVCYFLLVCSQAVWPASFDTVRTEGDLQTQKPLGLQACPDECSASCCQQLTWNALSFSTACVEERCVMSASVAKPAGWRYRGIWLQCKLYMLCFAISWLLLLWPKATAPIARASRYAGQLLNMFLHVVAWQILRKFMQTNLNISHRGFALVRTMTILSA